MTFIFLFILSFMQIFLSQRFTIHIITSFVHSDYTQRFKHNYTFFCLIIPVSTAKVRSVQVTPYKNRYRLRLKLAHVEDKDGKPVISRQTYTIYIKKQANVNCRSKMMERLRSNYIIILHDKEIQSRRVKININERVYITYFSKRNLKIVKKSTKKFCDKFNNAKNS